MPNRPKIFKPPRIPKKPKDTRPSASRRGYGAAWQRARKRYLAKHPLCVHCERLEKATVVDHIIPKSPQDPTFWDTTNWQPLCASCHGVKTAKHDGGFGANKSKR